uniref:ZP domain-containing protein n=1 Tax=Romanomermis culicivorax TaxID=13658 RepID=A0A915J092_ROMCU
MPYGGIPEVECLQDSITIVFDLKEKFFGRIYVMGYANDSRCTSIQRGRATTSVIIRRDLCGVTNLRSANPPGVVSNVKVVISFHPQFITKVDRGFEISCFYMEVNRTVIYPISVKPEETMPITQFSDMPICEYKVMQKSTKNDLETQLASVVSLGEKLYHKWTCKSSTTNLWCMTVHSCYVKDTVGNKIEIVDENGCSIDKYIMGAIEDSSPKILTNQ